MSIARKTVETFGVRIVAQVADVVASILLARALGPFGRGVFSYVTTVCNLFLRLNGGQSAAISWQYGRLRRPSREVFGAMLRILGYGGIPLAFIIAVTALAVRGQLSLIAVAVALPFAFFSQMAAAFYLADGKVRILNIQNLITSVGFLVMLTLALLLLHLGVAAMLFAWAGSYVGSALYSVVMLKPYGAGYRRATVVHLKEQATFGLRASANSLLGYLNFRIDIFIILFILGAKALGIYSIAIGAGELMWQLSGPLAQSAFGRINSGSMAESMQLTARCVRHSMVIVTIGCLVLFIIGPTVITVLYGKAFAGAGVALRLLLPGIVAYSMMPFFSTFFTQQLGKPTTPLIILSASTLICAAITFATVRPWGIAGGAIGTSVSYFTALIISVVLFKRETGMSMKALFGFKREDIRPYQILLASFWKRTSSFALGRRGQ